LPSSSQAFSSKSHFGIIFRYINICSHGYDISYSKTPSETPESFLRAKRTEIRPWHCSVCCENWQGIELPVTYVVTFRRVITLWITLLVVKQPNKTRLFGGIFGHTFARIFFAVICCYFPPKPNGISNHGGSIAQGNGPGEG
jgi:hypothetical protein